MNTPQHGKYPLSLPDTITLKQEEIKNYERILKEYGSGRWYDMGRRHLASLKEDLKQLQALSAPNTPKPP